MLFLVFFSSLALAQADLPDPRITPGLADPAVTQANIERTICSPGYSSRMRPSSSYTSRLKREQIEAYGFEDADPAHYEEDHLISIELGGDPRDPRNLWPQHWEGCGAHRKDVLENRLHLLVCSGDLPLAEAQRAIAKNWIAAYRRYIGKEPCK